MSFSLPINCRGCSMDNIIFYWFIVAIFFLLFELSSPGFFYFLSFSCGAFVASLAAAFCFSQCDQAMFFLFSSIAALFLLRMWVRRHNKKSHYHSNMYALQGKQGVVITPATVQQFGYVHINAEVWACKSLHNEFIPAGSSVQVIDVRGVHLIVTAINST